MLRHHYIVAFISISLFITDIYLPTQVSASDKGRDAAIIVPFVQLEKRDKNFVSGFQKDDYETTKEYYERVEKIEIPFTQQFFIVEGEVVEFSPDWDLIGKYNADRGTYTNAIFGNKIIVYVPREKAKKIAERVKRKGVHIEGKIRYYDKENAEVFDLYLLDEITQERYSIAKADEKGHATSYVPKPGIKKATVENIHDIPDFKAQPRKDDVAIVIGVEHYQSLPSADFSKSDAGIVKDYLKALGFQERNIEFLIDERATKSGIEKSIEAWLPNRVKKNSSSVFIYYSGHGAPDPATGEANLVPYDGDPNYLSVTGYPINRLYDKLGKLQVKDVIIVLDACFSGAGGRSVLAKGTRPIVIVAEGPILHHNMAVLTATQGTQISTSSPEKGHGLFTWYFLKAIKDGKGDLAEIYEQIKPQIEDEAKTLNVQQSPSLRPGVAAVKGKFSLRN